MARKRIPVYETTPYGTKQHEGGFVVWQMWHDRIVSPPFPTQDQADEELLKVARENRCLRKRWL